jgi:hypothetical protein
MIGPVSRSKTAPGSTPAKDLRDFLGYSFQIDPPRCSCRPLPK